MRKAWLLLLLSVPAWALGLVSAAPAPAAQDVYLQLDGIKGESQAKGFKDAIDVQSFSWGVSNPAGGQRGFGGAGAGRATFSDLSIEKRLDSSSPSLMVHVANGQLIRTGVMTIVNAGETPVPYYRLCLQNIRVTSDQYAGSSETPQESVTFAYGAIQQIYSTQNSEGGLGTPFIGGWDLLRNLQLGSPICGGSTAGG
jgi:type VI secretion system secreted protein Hcp